MDQGRRERPSSEVSSMSEHRGSRNHRTGLLLTLVTAMSLFAASPAAAYHSFVIPAADNGCGVDP